jgi:hypothetical protein
MNNLEKEFVPYQQSIDMKELGFDEPCFGIHFEEGLNPFLMFASQYGEEGASANGGILAPTFSQAFRFFIERYDLEGVTQRAEDFMWYKWKIHQCNENGKKYVADWYEYNTYEEAELACLIKLIEITKSGSLKA